VTKFIIRKCNVLQTAMCRSKQTLTVFSICYISFHRRSSHPIYWLAQDTKPSQLVWYVQN